VSFRPFMVKEVDYRVDAKKSALVIVDMQNDGFTHHGEGLRKIIPIVQKFLERARRAKLNIIHVQSIRKINSPQYLIYGRNSDLIEGKWEAEIVEGLRPKRGEALIKKDTHDCFLKTTMDKTLKDLNLKPGKDTIIATGIGANNCLYHAVIGFHIRHYKVLVPLDCTHSSKPMGMKFLKWQMNQGAYNYNVKLTSSDSIIFD